MIPGIAAPHVLESASILGRVHCLVRPTLALPLALQVLSQEPEVPTREVVAVYDMELLMVDAFLSVTWHIP